MTDNATLLKTAVKRIEDAYSADLPHREMAESDLRFAIGEGQWRDEDRAAREEDGRPCLTLNRMPQFLRKVTAQIRALNPAIRVTAADQQASEETAEVIEGLIRQIEASCDAASIYESAAESAAACGIGYWRILTRYCEGLTFDQEITLEPIRNQFSVFVDPFAKEPTRADARYMFIAEDIPLETFKEQYPDAAPSDVTGNNSPSSAALWSKGEKVTVAEYYWIEEEDVTIGLLADGQVIRDPKPPMQFVAKRTVKEPRVKWAKITRDAVLEGPQDVPGRYIPIVAVTGEEWHIGEQTYRSSVIRFAKDAQILYNYSRSMGAELMDIQTRAPWLVTSKQIAGLEQYWNQANKNLPYLPYTPDEAAGAPQRINPPVPSQAVMAEIQMAAEDMKSTTGIYDASLGARSNETSGVAIAQRQQESEASTSSYADNMVKGIHHTGKIIIGMIPAVYDTKRVIRILGENDEEKQVVINNVMVEMGQQFQTNAMTVGKYDVRVSVGPTYQSKREESARGMMDFMQAIPQAAPVVADLVAGMQDWPKADEVAERLKKTLPPGMAEDNEPSPEQQQQQMLAMQQQQQAMQMQQAAAQAQAREQDAKARKAEADAAKAEAEAEKAQIELAQMQMGRVNPGIPPGAPFGAVNPQGF